MNATLIALILTLPTITGLVPVSFTMPVVVTADAGGNLQSISFSGHQ